MMGESLASRFSKKMLQGQVFTMLVNLIFEKGSLKDGDEKKEPERKVVYFMRIEFAQPLRKSFLVLLY